MIEIPDIRDRLPSSAMTTLKNDLIHGPIIHLPIKPGEYERAWKFIRLCHKAGRSVLGDQQIYRHEPHYNDEPRHTIESIFSFSAKQVIDQLTANPSVLASTDGYNDILRETQVFHAGDPNLLNRVQYVLIKLFTTESSGYHLEHNTQQEIANTSYVPGYDSALARLAEILEDDYHTRYSPAKALDSLLRAQGYQRGYKPDHFAKAFDLLAEQLFGNVYDLSRLPADFRELAKNELYRSILKALNKYCDYLEYVDVDKNALSLIDFRDNPKRVQKQLTSIASELVEKNPDFACQAALQGMREMIVKETHHLKKYMKK